MIDKHYYVESDILENRNVVSKLMNKLLTKKGNLLSTQETILSETMNHYIILVKNEQMFVKVKKCLKLSFPKQTLSNTEQQQIEVI